VLVGSVTAGGAAEKAGIEAGDVLVALGGVEVQGVEHYTELLRKQTIGKVVTVRVRREGAEVDLQVTIGSRPARR
jgi:S1-C subfamily serine protease